jgi:dephospho-CoA kinase
VEFIVIIGVTGPFCSGKDTFAEYLVMSCGYKHFSLSDVMKEMLISDSCVAKKYKREDLISFGFKIRNENGNGILAKNILEKIDFNKNYCLTSIRHSDEVIEFKKTKKFVLINVDAPKYVRFLRMKKRNRFGDPDTFDKFLKLESKEFKTVGSYQQLGLTASMSDFTIINNFDNIPDFYFAIYSFLNDNNLI